MGLLEQRRETGPATPGVQSEATRWAALHGAALGLLEAEPGRALELAQEALQLAAELADRATWADSSQLLGRALMANGDLAAALEQLTAAARTFAALEDPLGQAGSEELAGKVCLNLGQLDEAAQYLQSAIARSEVHRSDRAVAIRATALNHLAGVQHMQGASADALSSLQTALNLWETQGQFSGQAHCLSNLGIIQTALGQYPEAVGSLSRAYGLYQEHLNDVRSEAFILLNLARVHHQQGDRTLATDVMRAACTAAEASRYPVIQATAQVNLGTFCLDGGLYEEARGHLDMALRLSRQAGYRAGELSALDSLGSLYERTGATPEASAAHSQALEIALEIGDTQGELEARLHLGQLHLAAGEYAPAFEELNAALVLAREVQLPREEAAVHQALAEGHQSEGRYREALEHFTQLRRIERELFDADRDRQTRNLSVQFEVERAQHDAAVYRMRTEVEQEARRAAEHLVQERTAELARAQHEVVTRLAMAAEYRDDTTGEHTRRVGRASARIARALGWSEERAGTLGIAARLHDVGKIGIPDTVLLKPGKLDTEQYAQMQTHTLIGARILSGGRSELLRLAEEIALTHHERWDGQGYPRGLSGEQIPLSGRIVAVADVFDALTQARPYKRAWTPQEAMREITEQTGTHFDPQVIETARWVLASPDDAADAANHWTNVGSADDLPFAQEDASHVLAVFEQLLVERTRELEVARQFAERTAQDMQRMALTDSLTGLANRRAFEADLEAAFAVARANEHARLAVLSFDLDGLKKINDTLGHDGGDGVLRAFGEAMAAEFVGLGQAYRMGGDEFALISTELLEDQLIETRLEALLARVRQQGFPSAGASSGVARFPEDAQTPGDLLRVSDRRMYRHKLERRVGR